MNEQAHAAPTLETSRLRLRAHGLDDFAVCAEMWASPIVTRHIGGRPFTAEESWSRLLRYAGHWSLLGFGYWAVVERATDRFVGEVGFADFHRDITPSFAGAPEAGWVLAPWSYGNGFATEAITAAAAWLDAALAPERTVCIIDPENLASIRVAEKCGYVAWQKTSYHGSDVLAFERRRRA
jgi:RimJ/RimL family protein N-acetyltransferase